MQRFRLGKATVFPYLEIMLHSAEDLVRSVTAKQLLHVHFDPCHKVGVKKGILNIGDADSINPTLSWNPTYPSPAPSQPSPHLISPLPAPHSALWPSLLSLPLLYLLQIQSYTKNSQNGHSQMGTGECRPSCRQSQQCAKLCTSGVPFETHPTTRSSGGVGRLAYVCALA